MTAFYLVASGLLFLYLYWLVPNHWRLGLVAVANAVFLLGFGWPVFVLHLVSCLFNYWASRFLSSKFRTVVMIESVVS